MNNTTSQLVPKLYPLLEEAIEYGVRRGWSRAHKHTDKPTEEQIFQTIPECVMQEICERFHLIEPKHE